MRGVRSMGGLFALALAGTVLAGCSGVSGLFPSDALLRVPSGQFHRGAPPSDVSGPALGQFGARTPVFPGEISTLVSGLAAPEATGVIVYIEGDVGYWVITPTTSSRRRTTSSTSARPSSSRRRCRRASSS
jgi:hypothetical protein